MSKFFKLRTVELGPNRTFEYRRILLDIVWAPSNGTSMDIHEMRKWLPIAEKIADANGVLELTDSEYEQLNRKVQGFNGWTAGHLEIIKFVDAFNNASEIEVKV